MTNDRIQQWYYYRVFVRYLPKNKLTSIPYFTRIKEMDRVGVEPTTAATAGSLFVVKNLFHCDSSYVHIL
jgi:hypothetical protein